MEYPQSSQTVDSLVRFIYFRMGFLFRSFALYKTEIETIRQKVLLLRFR